MTRANMPLPSGADARKHAGTVIGRIKFTSGQDRFDVIRRARTMPWWRPGSIIAGHDSRMWVIVQPGSVAK